MPTFNLISKQTLGSDVSTVTFSSIPQTYTDLFFIINVKTSSTGETAYFGYYQINGDTANNYNYSYAYAVGGSSYVSGYAVATTNQGRFTLVQPNDNNPRGGARLYFGNYANTSMRKSAIGSGGFANPASFSYGKSFIGGSKWNSTSAITSVLLAPSSGSFKSGSVLSLYGISNA